MKSGELIELMAKATGIPSATVAMHFRVAREAGLMTTGARGVNAPEMSLLDAARLLISLAVTDRPSAAAQAMTDFGNLHCSRQDIKKKKGALQVKPQHLFEEGVVALIHLFSVQPPIGCKLHLRLDSLDCAIHVPAAAYLYHDKDLLAATDQSEKSDALAVAEAFTARSEAYLARAARYTSKIHTEKVIGPDVLCDIAEAFGREAS